MELGPSVSGSFPDGASILKNMKNQKEGREGNPKDKIQAGVGGEERGDQHQRKQDNVTGEELGLD